MKKIILLFLFSNFAFSQNLETILNKDLLNNLSYSKNDKIIILDNKKALICYNSNSVYFTKICQNEIIYSKRLSKKYVKKFNEAFEILSELNQNQLNVNKKDDGQAMIIADGEQLKMELFTNNNSKIIASYSPQQYIDLKFPFFEKRKIFLDTFRNLLKLCTDIEFERLKKLDTLYIFLDKSMRIRNLVFQDTLKNKRQENYTIQYKCAYVSLYNLNTFENKTTQNSNYVTKSFLNINKHKILKNKVLNQLFDCELGYLLRDKIIYVIDENKKKNGKYLISQFNGYTNCINL